MKAKTTRRALLMSALSLLLCVSMLVGTTFAWFTDSVTSGRNTIQAGNLDVVLEYWDGDSYEEVTSTTKLFDDAALWEPGYTEVAYLKVSNAGSLALKYQLAVNVYNETLGKTKDSADIKLSDHLQFKVVESDTDLADTYTRETAQNANATATKLQTYNSEVKPLDAKNEAGDNNYYDYVALIIYMPETVGNEANHNGVNVPSIEMGVNLFATQQTAESDSFNNQYDKEATFVITANSEATLDAALTNGGNIIIEGTITDTTMQAYSATTNAVTLFRPTKDTTLSGGKIIMDNSAANWGFVVDAKNNVNVTVKDTAIVGNNNWNMHNIVELGSKLIIDNVDVSASGGSGIYVTGGGEAVINNATVAQDGLNPDAAPWAATAVATSTKSNVTINGGTYEGTTNAVYIYNSGATVTINGGTFKAPNVLKGDGNYSDGDDAVVATIIVNDGTFDGSIVANNGNALITINGGNFTNFAFNNGGWNKRGVLVIKGGTFDADPSNWVDTNAYNVTEANGLWTVTAK